MKKKTFFLALALTVTTLVGCGSRGAGGSNEGPAEVKPTQASMDDFADIMNPEIDNTNRKEPEKLNTGNNRLIATSVAGCEITDKLDLDLVGAPITNLGRLPDRYKEIPQIGMPMNPNVEIMMSLKPTKVYTPSSLSEWLEPNFKKVKLPYEFINLSSIDGFYETIEHIGKENDRADIAKSMLDKKDDYINALRERHKNDYHPKVLLIMGLPGSYVVATPNSYIGNLLELAGGENVFAGSSKNGEEFLNLSPEAMLEKDPDIIMRAAHAMPETIDKMFEKEFKENGIWKHFRAIKEGKLYDLPHDYFGMSANVDYVKGLDHLEKILYGGE
ncbi:MAG: heme ABC transporter substrate-binding protein IsdE [Eubacteriales bacterium]|nr:heme ABC transporter substrate-binding protein IsdE [Eubacteriales bacterium]